MWTRSVKSYKYTLITISLFLSFSVPSSLPLLHFSLPHLWFRYISLSCVDESLYTPFPSSGTMGPLDEQGELAEFNKSSLFKLDHDLVFTDWVKKVSYIFSLFIYIFSLFLLSYFGISISGFEIWYFFLFYLFVMGFCVVILPGIMVTVFLLKLRLGVLVSVHVI